MGLLDDILKRVRGGVRAASGGGGGGTKSGGPPAAKPKADFSDVQSGSSTTAPRPPPTSDVYVVVAGDNLSKIAKRFYGDAKDWRRIYEANRSVIGANPDLIKPGQKLEIPKA